MANRNFSNGGKLFMMESQPVLATMQFKVAVADSGGLGITGLKSSSLVQNVFMHTSATPGAGNKQLLAGGPSNISITNPNPATGFIVIQMNDNYKRLLGMRWSIVSDTNGTPVKIDNSAMTAGVPYVISTLGNSTAAKWHAIGVPAGITPAVGVSFIAASDGGSANTSTSRAAPVLAAGSNILSMEIVGDPQLMLSPSPSANQGFGSQLIIACRNDSAADAPQIATPTDGIIISIELLLSNSSVSVGGQ